MTVGDLKQHLEVLEASNDMEVRVWDHDFQIYLPIFELTVEDKLGTKYVPVFIGIN